MDVQEDLSKYTMKCMVKVSRVSGDMVVAALKYLLKKLHDREPVGKQSLDKLLAGGHDVRRSEITSDADMKSLQRLARRHHVGVSVIKNQDGTFSVYFRAKRAEQFQQCVKDYTQQKLARQGREPVSVKLQRATSKATQRNDQSMEKAQDRKLERTTQKERSR